MDGTGVARPRRHGGTGSSSLGERRLEMNGRGHIVYVAVTVMESIKAIEFGWV